MHLKVDDALARLRAGDPAGAERILRGILATTPDSPQALDLLGASLATMGRLDEAIAAYRKALSLDPSMWAAHNDLGNALRGRGLHAEALEHYAAAARLAPDSVDAASNYAAALRESGRPMGAAAVLEAALRRRPDSPDLLEGLGALYYDANRVDEAERCLRRALELAPDMIGPRINLGNLCAVQGRVDEAIEMYRGVVARNPSIPDVQSNLGIALQEKGDVQGAMACYELALAARPDHPEALNNLGYLLHESGRREEAVRRYERALEANPRFALAQYNLAAEKLGSRQFAEGWRLAESRFAIVPPVAIDRAFPVPRLTSENLRGARKAAVWAEQGIGDQILYGTMLPDLAKRSVPFVLEVDSRLLAAFRRAHPEWEVVGAEESAAAFAACDRHIPVASLGAILRPDVQSFAGQPKALLAADRARAEAMRRSLGSGNRRIVGISWRSFQQKNRAGLERRKSASLADFLDLSRRDDLLLVDLQYGDTAEERNRFAAQGGRLARIEGLDLFEDIDGVLAAVEACDLVVTTSNVTAHFAGALGKDARLLYLAGVPPFHYWSTDESGRCLWYPSIRIVTALQLRWPDLIAQALVIPNIPAQGT
jgi:tetratricopeptide (TPR) repeat protein